MSGSYKRQDNIKVVDAQSVRYYVEAPEHEYSDEVNQDKDAESNPSIQSVGSDLVQLGLNIYSV